MAPRGLSRGDASPSARGDRDRDPLRVKADGTTGAGRGDEPRLPPPADRTPIVLTSTPDRASSR
jgi:hypothetical protein